MSAATTFAGVAVVVITITITITIVIAVPSMVVFDPAARSVPIAYEELTPVITCCHPSRPAIRRAGPVPVMPHVVS